MGSRLATGHKGRRMKYLTDGIHLYEIAAQRVVDNYGLLRGKIGYVVIRDCVTDAVATMGELDLAALSEVPHSGDSLG